MKLMPIIDELSEDIYEKNKENKLKQLIHELNKININLDYIRIQQEVLINKKNKLECKIKKES